MARQKSESLDGGFRASLKMPPESHNVADRFTGVVSYCADAIKSAMSVRAMSVTTKSIGQSMDLSVDRLVAMATSFYKNRLDLDYGLLIRAAKQASCLAEIKPIADKALQGLARLGRCATTDALSLYLSDEVNLYASSTAAIESALADLKRQAALLEDYRDLSQPTKASKITAYLVDHPNATLMEVSHATGISKSAVQRNKIWQEARARRKAPRRQSEQ